MTELQSDYVLVPPGKEPSERIITLIKDFRTQIEILEVKNAQQIQLFQDGKNDAYYIDTHILSSVVGDFLDYAASLDPEEQEEIKANRNLQSIHKAFLRMQDDAKKGRQFNDIIVEFLPTGTKADKPLKIFGGQHRSKSIEEAVKSGIERYHGFRVYFGLTVHQRSDIAQVSNTNISVPIDLFDRMQETLIGPELRNWCRKIGLLGTKDDFAERKNSEGIITARMARTFVVNYIIGKEIKGVSMNKPFENLVGNDANEKYISLSQDQRQQYFNDPDLLAAGKQFALLHKTQMERVKSDTELSKINEFKTKALTPSVLSAWFFCSGLLQRDKKKLEKLYQLPLKSKGKNPLAVKEMSEYKHQSDPKTYRGLGTRTEKKERGKLIELFLLYSDKQEPKITTPLIDAAVTNYLSYILIEERKKKAAKIK
ncbi:MAG: hypothetical protein HZB59_09855 [Ignavibacteriales bacterium]|nr:hypothetical protein [Ignavibacteriales bacterium]